MNCLEHERLFSYANRLLDEPEMTQFRTHVEGCSQCRAVVESYARVDAVLGEWPSVEPSAWFDVRVRQAVKAQAATATGRGPWGWRWRRRLALAALGVLLISGVVWLTHRPRAVSDIASHAAPRSSPVAPAPTQVAKLKPPVVTPRHVEKPVTPATVVNPAPEIDDDDEALTADDDALLANFDVLSELPKTETRVAHQ